MYVNKADSPSEEKRKTHETKSLLDILTIDMSFMTADSFYRYWLEEVKRPILTSDSYQTYKNCVYNYILPYMGHQMLSELAEKHIEGLYQNAVSRSTSTAKGLKAVVTSSMKYALAEQEISRDPSENVRLPKSTSHPVESSIHPETLTEKQVKCFTCLSYLLC